MTKFCTSFVIFKNFPVVSDDRTDFSFSVLFLKIFIQYGDLHRMKNFDHFKSLSGKVEHRVRDSLAFY